MLERVRMDDPLDGGLGDARQVRALHLPVDAAQTLDGVLHAREGIVRSEEDLVPIRTPPPPETSNETEEQSQQPLPSYETVAVPRPAQPPAYSPVPSPPPAKVNE